MNGGDFLNSGTYIVLLLLFVILLSNSSQNKQDAAVKIIQRKRKRKRKEGRPEMTELAKQFIGKECLIYTFNNSQINGVVRDVVDGAILVESNGSLEAVNIDFITRIREFPKKKNGKKKSIVLD